MLNQRGGTSGLCTLHRTHLRCKRSVPQQHGLKQQGFKDITLLHTLQALEINQAPVSQLRFRNVVQGHKGELSNIKHISLTLLPFLLLF